MLEDVDAVLAAVASLDYREDDPIAGRERFYRQRVTDKVRWLRVVVDLNSRPELVVTEAEARGAPAQPAASVTVRAWVGALWNAAAASSDET